MFRTAFTLGDAVTAAMLLAATIGCAGGAIVIARLRAVPPETLPPVDAAELAPRVETITLEPQDLRIEFTTRGVLQPAEEFTARAEVAGEVKDKRVEIGQTVAAGEVLLEIEAELQSIVLAEAEANEQQAALAAQHARRQLERAQQSNNAQALTDAANQKDAADAAHELARRQTATARAKHQRRIVTAPISGVVSAAPLSVGQFVAEGVAAVTIVRTDQLAFEAKLTTTQLLALHDDVQCRVHARGETFTAPLAYVAPQADPATRRIVARLLIDNPQQRLRPGLPVEAAFDCGLVGEALVLPRRALVDEGGSPFCYRIVERDGRSFAERAAPQYRSIVGRADSVLVTGGLIPGDRIAIGGLLELDDGVEVVPK